MMLTATRLQVLTTAALLAALALPARAASSAASSASESLAVSVGSISESFHASSNSSDTRPTRPASGDYKVIDVAEAGRPGMLKLTLAPLQAEGDAFELILPEQAAQAGGVAAGQVVQARQHDYGMSFARAETGSPFFLVLEDDWYRELDSHRVTL